MQKCTFSYSQLDSLACPSLNHYDIQNHLYFIQNPLIFKKKKNLELIQLV